MFNKESARVISLVFKKFLFFFRCKNGVLKYRKNLHPEKFFEGHFFFISLKELLSYFQNLSYYLKNFPILCLDCFQVCIKDIMVHLQEKLPFLKAKKNFPRIQIVPDLDLGYEKFYFNLDSHPLFLSSITIYKLGKPRISRGWSVYSPNLRQIQKLYYEEISEIFSNFDSDLYNLPPHELIVSLDKNVLNKRHLFIYGKITANPKKSINGQGIVVYIEEPLTRELSPGNEIKIAGQIIIDGDEILKDTVLNDNFPLPKNALVYMLGYSKEPTLELYTMYKEKNPDLKTLMKIAHEGQLLDWFSLFSNNSNIYGKFFSKAIICQLFSFFENSKDMSGLILQPLNIAINCDNYNTISSIKNLLLNMLIPISEEGSVFRNLTFRKKNILSLEIIHEMFSCFFVSKTSRYIVIDDLSPNQLDFFEEVCTKFALLELFPDLKRKNLLSSFLFISNPLHKKNQYFFTNFTEDSFIFNNLCSFDLIIDKKFFYSSSHNAIDIKKTINKFKEIYNEKKTEQVLLGGIDIKIFIKFVNFINKKTCPNFSKKSLIMLQTCYFIFRKETEDFLPNKKDTVLKNSIKKIESLIKIVKAICKMRISKYIENRDVTKALSMLRDFKNL